MLQDESPPSGMMDIFSLLPSLLFMIIFPLWLLRFLILLVFYNLCQVIGRIKKGRITQWLGVQALGIGSFSSIPVIAEGKSLCHDVCFPDLLVIGVRTLLVKAPNVGSFYTRKKLFCWYSLHQFCK